MAANSRGVLVRCSEIVKSARHANRGKYHSKKCLEWTHARRALGFVLGDVYVKWGRGKSWREKAGLPLDPRISPGRCIGIVVNSNHILVQCPAKVKPGEGSYSEYVRYHSKACYTWTRNRKRDGLALGDTYIKWQRRKHHQPKRCQGWIVRDGMIAQCTETFTAVTTRQKHHSLACMYQTRRWRKIGCRLGDSIRRTCAYRNCKKGDGGKRGTFDRIRQRSGTRDHYCDPRCAAAEQRARKDEIIAAKLAELALLKGQRPTETRARIILAAFLSLQQPKPSKGVMKFQLYPKQNIAAAAKSATKVFFSRQREEIEREMKRQASLPEATRLKDAESARSLLAAA